MKDKLHEQLSALVDDELEEQELALLLKQLEVDEALSWRLARYQLISDSLQNHLPSSYSGRFHQRVRAALGNEAPVHARRLQLAAWVKPLSGVALAASVAVVAVLSLQSTRGGGEDAAPAVASATARDNYLLAADEVQKPGDTSRGRQNLEIYLANHSEYAVNRGMLPYMRLVGHGMNSDRKE